MVINMNNELVSVILPTYNRRKTIKRAIDSVLNQTYQNIELIIVDDNSTDGTIDLVSELYGDDERILYIMNESNMGPSGARNAGVDAAKGEIIAFHDSDDAWHLDKLERQMDMLRKAPGNVGMIYCQFVLHTSEGKEVIWPSENIPMNEKSGDIFNHLLIRPLCSTQTMLIRKNCYMEIGGFRADIHSLVDYEFSIRLAKKYQILLCNKPLVDVYETAGSVGKQHDERIRVECLLMNQYRDDLEKFGLKAAKMTTVWMRAMSQGNIEVIEDNIGMLISDNEYCQTFAVLESKRLAEIMANSKSHIGIFLNDENITFGNGIRPEKGNPGIEENLYNLLLLVRFLAKNDNEIAVTVYHLNNRNILPYDVKSVIVSDKYDALNQCKKDKQDCIIFNFESDSKWYDTIDEYAVLGICLQPGLAESDDSAFTEILLQNDNIKKIICNDEKAYETLVDKNNSDTAGNGKAIHLNKLYPPIDLSILKTWEEIIQQM